MDVEDVVRQLARRIELLENDLRELRSSALSTDASPQPVPWASHPLYMPEETEDAAFQLEQGLISKDQYEKLLEETNFLNTEIQFDES